MEEIDQGWQLFNTKNNLNNLIDFSLISFGNSLYTFGGYEKESNQITNQLREFNFETNAWKYKNLESISERISHTGTVRNGKLYILGGSNESYLKDFHCYNFELDHVALFPSLKNGIAGHTCILNERDNNFYIVGGNLDDGTPNEDLLCFDFEVGEWKTIDFTGEPPLLVDHSCICYGSKMYTFGGTDSKTSNFSNSIYEFDFKLSKWKKLLISGNTDIIPTPRSRHSCVQFYHTFIIHGGSTSSNVFLNDMWIFDLDSLIWTEIDQNSQNSLFVPSPRRDHKIVIHSDSIFLFGGKEKIGKANDKKIFKFELLKNPVFSKFEKQIYFKKSEENIGNIFSFGYGAHGQLGHNNNDNLDYPKKIESLLNEKIIKICCGGGHSVCLTTKGQLYLWGDGRTSAIPQIKPRKITEFRNDFVLNVACGSLHTIAVLADENGHPGPVYVWGDEISTTKSQPRLVNSLFGKKIIDLDCTALETIVLTDDSFIYSWSIESETQLKLVATNETHNFTKITCGGGHTLILTSTAYFSWDYCALELCANFALLKIFLFFSKLSNFYHNELKKKGKLLSFGFKCKHGQLGRGQYDENQDSTTPEEIEYFAENNIKVGTMACGDDHSLVVDENGDLFTFGYGHNGQLGHQNLESQFYPKKVQFLEGKKIFQVAGGGGLGCSHSVVVCVSGEIYVFGSNSHSQLGFEASKICLKPYLLNFNELTFQVSCGWIHTLLLVEKKEDFENALEEIDPNNTMGCFGICPNFILDDILLLLDWREIGKLSLVSSSFKNISERNEIWSSLFYRQFAESNLMEFAGKSSKQKFKSRFNPQKVESSSSTSIFSKVSMKIGSLFVGKNEFRILMPGMDAAGKTTVLYKLKLGETVTTIPTIGFNVETVDYKKASLTVWDVGGPDKIRPLWRHYYQNTQAIIWVVDSNDRERQDEYREELHKMLNDDEMRDAILLVYANKQDLPNALSVAEASCATTGDGLYEGLDWLVSELMK